YKKNREKTTDNMKMLLAKLYKLEENDTYAHWILHKGLNDNSYPSEDNFDYWSISFPIPFEKEVKESLKKLSIPEPLVYSIMRQESAFNPKAQSFSNAYGLMQLLYSTARVVKKGTNLKLYSYWSLFNPEINIPLGSTYLQNLMELFNNNLVYSSASYNAGEKRVEKWVKNFGNLPIDEFIENIPINQTRDYVKKVLTGYIAYEYLYQNSSLYFTPLKGVKESKSFFYKEKK
ncbi:lytic transglycosylase domain-containing protein, partial [bacterium]|nr:lytic transglycosylase domain-containing protein [bacterium]